ncbi:MAG: YraN family protein [Rhodocyclaceae bacterium]|nr:YraN family protein [Rhodocyclaceae bacterium]
MLHWLGDRIRRIVGRGMAPSQAAGAIAEARAARLMRRHGGRVLARNVRCRGGEIDLVVEDGGTIAFVEVRYRRGDSHGGAAGSIDRTKQARIVRAARHWLATDGRGHAHRACRFDAVVFDGGDTRGPTWLRGAFDAE